ncbi:MAG TPA: glycosyltransferase family 39 protein [Lacipirellulaceae bacterium]|jgi:4-amino-4-deoxy-L-arabinose transferase-like glycosyltransferase
MSDHPWRNTFAVAAIAAVMFLTALGSTRLWDEDEPKNAACGQEMLSRGDWIVPTFNGQLRTDKPILLYWCMLAVYNVLGVSELTARLPSALAGVGTVVLTYHLGRMLFNRRSGLIASCLLACALNFAVLARAATPDSLLILCITASLASFVAGVATRHGGHFSGCVLGQTRYCSPITEVGLPALACVGMYVAMGLAVLAKGPIGVVMPLGITGSYLMFGDGAVAMPAGGGWLRRWSLFLARCIAPRNVFRMLQTLRVWWGLPLAALIAVPWYLAVGVQTHGQWLLGFLGTHNIGRFMHPMENHHGLPLYYLVAILIGFFPGSVFLPVAIWSSANDVRDKGDRRPSAAFVLCWIGCYLGFFTMAATKLPNYVVPCYPALALATGTWLAGATLRATARDWRLLAGYSTLGIVGLATAIGLGIAAQKVLNMSPSLALPGLVALVGGLICVLLLRGNRVQASLTNFVATCLLTTAAGMTYTASLVSPLADGPNLAARINALAVAHDHAPGVATYRYSPPTLVYYLRHPVARLETDQLATFFDRGDVLIMPRDAYDRERKRLPSDVQILGEEQRFLHKNNSVVMLGRATDVARGDNGDVQTH